MTTVLNIHKDSMFMTGIMTWLWQYNDNLIHNPSNKVLLIFIMATHTWQCFATVRAATNNSQQTCKHFKHTLTPLFYPHLCDDICIVEHICHLWVRLQELLNLGIGQNELSGQLGAGGREGALHEGTVQYTAHHLWVGQQLALHLALECREEARAAVC